MLLSMASLVLHTDVILLTLIASRIFNVDALSRVIYRVFDITHFLDLHLDFGLVSALSSGIKGAIHIRQELELVFNKPGQSKLVSTVAKAAKAKSMPQEVSATVVRLIPWPSLLSDRVTMPCTGIADIENAAQRLAAQPNPGREAMGNTSLYRFLSDDQWLESRMRLGIERGFEAILKDRLGAEELQALKDVFFQLLYRSGFGGRMRG